MIAFLTLASTPVVAQDHPSPHRQDGDATQPGPLARADQAFAFTIPRTPLTEALAEFSATTGLQMRYMDQPPPGITSSPLIGSYTAAEALQHLLAGTGFTAQAAYQFKNFRFFAFVNNLFDRDYELLIFSDTAQLGDPREFGFGLQVSF
jgi:hypothetical protein